MSSNGRYIRFFKTEVSKWEEIPEFLHSSKQLFRSLHFEEETNMTTE